MNQLPLLQFWLTHADQSVLLHKQPATILVIDSSANFNDELIIEIDAAQTYQSMEGFGFSLTGGSAYLINHLAASARTKLLQEIFSNENDGIGVNYLRMSIGASDLSETAFSYHDIPDSQLIYFDLSAGDRDLIPVLHEIIAINPRIKIMATPWSAPPWMKTNHSFIGGQLQRQYYSLYAQYFVRYLCAMQKNGITIHALTPQNEPMNAENEPSMIMDAIDQADFIKNYLGPALRAAGFTEIELFCWDHNCDRKEYPLTVLADCDARNYLTGVAWHLYGGTPATLSEIQHAYPDMKMVFTEQWVGADGNFADDFIWHIKNVLIGTLRNWSSVVLEWNLASDPNYGPHTPQGAARCVGAVTIDQRSGAITRNVSYYVIAHAAKFIPPGSLRIFSSQLDQLPNVAFQTPTGEIILLALNENNAPQTFVIQFGNHAASITLAGKAAATYLISVPANSTASATSTVTKRDTPGSCMVTPVR